MRIAREPVNHIQMGTTYWEWFEHIGLYALYDDGRFTGYHIESPEPDPANRLLGNLTGKFKLVFPGEENSVTYDLLDEAKEAAERFYHLDQNGLPPPSTTS